MLLRLPVIFVIVNDIVCNNLVRNLSAKSIPHDSNSLVFLGNLLLYTLDFPVFLEAFIVEFLLKGIFILVSIVGMALNRSRFEFFVLPAVGLFKNLSHNLVSHHLSVQDAVKSTVFGSFTTYIFLLFDGLSIAILESPKHLL